MGRLAVVDLDRLEQIAHFVQTDLLATYRAGQMLTGLVHELQQRAFVAEEGREVMIDVAMAMKPEEVANAFVERDAAWTQTFASTIQPACMPDMHVDLNKIRPIYQALKMPDPVGFALNQINNLSVLTAQTPDNQAFHNLLWLRGCGKTTMMLASAVADVQCDIPVCIRGHFRGHSEALVGLAREMASSIGARPELISTPPRGAEGINAGVYVDHWGRRCGT